MDELTKLRLNSCFTRMCLWLFNHYGSCEDCSSKICCTASAPAVHLHEIERIAKHSGTSVKKFKRKYVVKLDVELNQHVFKKPCPFIRNGHCRIYNVRPSSCWRYPFQTVSELGIIFTEGIELCPIVTQLADDVIEFFEKYRHLVPETAGMKEYTATISTATDKALGKIGGAWKDAGIENVDSEYMATSPLFFVCFYMFKVEKLNNIGDAMVNFQKNPDALVKYVLETFG